MDIGNAGVLQIRSLDGDTEFQCFNSTQRHHGLITDHGKSRYPRRLNLYEICDLSGNHSHIIIKCSRLATKATVTVVRFLDRTNGCDCAKVRTIGNVCYDIQQRSHTAVDIYAWSRYHEQYENDGKS